MPPKKANGTGANGRPPPRKRKQRPIAQPTARPLAPNKRQGPRSGGVNTSSGQVQSSSGYDFVTNILYPLTLSSQSTVLVDIPLAPVALSGTRWAQISVMFEKYRFTRCEMVYVPAVASVVGGQMISYWELDPNDSVDTTDIQQALRVAMAHQNAKMHNIYDSTQVVLPLRTGITDFFVERATVTSDKRWTRQATFRMVATAGLSGFLPSGVTSLIAGSVYMRWTCCFKNPQIQPTLVVPAGNQGTDPRKMHPSDRLSQPAQAVWRSDAIPSYAKTLNYYSLGPDSKPYSVPVYNRYEDDPPDHTIKFDKITSSYQPVTGQNLVQAGQYHEFINTGFLIVTQGKPPASTESVSYSSQSFDVGASSGFSRSHLNFALVSVSNGTKFLTTGNGPTGARFYDTVGTMADYGLPTLLITVINKIYYLGGWINENKELLGGAFHILKEVAGLTGTTTSSWQDYRQMKIDAGCYTEDSVGDIVYLGPGVPPMEVQILSKTNWCPSTDNTHMIIDPAADVRGVSPGTVMWDSVLD